MFKNVASQKLVVFAFDSTTNAPKTGDAANITAYVSKDYGAVTALGDTSAAEMDSTNAKGYYLFDLTQAETNADTLIFSAKSSTANIVVVAVPATVFTVPANFTATSIDSSGRLDIIKVNGTSQTARDIGGAVPAAAAGASGGLLINGSNTGSITFTGKLTITDGLAISRTTSGQAAVTLTGNGSGAGLSIAGGTTGNGISSVGGSTSGYGFYCVGQGALSSGCYFQGGAASGGTAAGHGLQIVGGTASTSSGGTAGKGVLITGGTGAASTNGAGAGLSLVGGSGTTVSGNSGLVIAATGSAVGLSLDTLTASGAVTFSGAVSLSSTLSITGAVTASNASNNIVGIDVAKIAGNATAATNAAAGWAGLIADTGTAQAGASSTITLRSGAVATDDYYTGSAVAITGGTGAGQVRKITGYVGSTKVATVDAAWATNPDNTSTYQALGRIV